MHSEGVLVQVEHSVFGSAKGSGLLINNIVIAHGSLLAPLYIAYEDFFKLYNIELEELQSGQSSTYHKTRHSSPIQFKVLRKNYLQINSPDQNEIGLGNKHKNSISCKDYTIEEAELCMIYKYKGLSDITKEISNWTYSETENESKNQLARIVQSKFIFLILGNSTENTFEKTLKTIYNSLKNNLLSPGLPVVVESTPFGAVSFLNSWSGGIISKIIGTRGDGIITDARLIIGCEGAPIYIFKDGVKGALVGIVIQTISWCDGQWIGFSLGLSIKCLLEEVLGLQSTIDYIPFQYKLQPELQTTEVNIDQLFAAVVFVRCQNKWGSGVVIDGASGLVLTCSHVIGYDHNSVTVLYDGVYIPATVVYATPPSTPYDVALLTIRSPGLKGLPLADSPPVIGERVITAGYPLSMESLISTNRIPTLSSGCVAKVSLRGGPLQTTCFTHCGVSGGAVIRPPNQLLGIVCSNVRFDGTIQPSFSFIVSVKDIKEPIDHYMQTKDPSYLKGLCAESCAVKMEWLTWDCKL